MDRCRRGDGTADLNMDSTPEIIVSNWDVEGMRVIHNFLPVNDSGGQDCVDGVEVEVMADSICLHGDTPGAVDMAKNLRSAFEQEGIMVKPLSEIV